MRFGMRRLQLFILLFAASSLLFQFPPEAFAATPSDITVTDTEIDGQNGFTKLGTAINVATFTIGSSTYAIVVAHDDVAGAIEDNGVQIIDISDPTNIIATDAETDEENGFDQLDGAYGVDTFTIGSSTYAIVVAQDDNGIQIIDISDPTNIVATDSETHGANGFDQLNSITGVDTFTIGSSTYAIVTAFFGVTIIDLNDPTNIVETDTGKDGENGFDVLLVSTGVDTFVIGSSTYAIVTSRGENGVQIIDISDPTNYELGSHIDYSVTKRDYYVSESELFQVAGATHRIVQDPDVKNLEMFEVVFTMVFAKPMDTSHIVVETKNIHGIPETIYLENALKVIERPIELLTMEEKSKFKIIYEPELKDSLRPGMDPEPDMNMLVADPEIVVSKATCGKGTMLKDNLCVPNEMSFYFFINQFMRFFG